ncbi:MAG: putative Sensory subunit of low CO2-induced protein complex [Bryobacterales bacterium]|nr:putative Sensory subunit of low CO2-induced protein complex [Bryobacterales bacterium]
MMAETSFRTLLGAMQTVGMIDRLQGSGPFTLFAPTDQAFAKMPAGTVENLEKPANAAKLDRFLNAHLAKGRYGSNDLSQRLTVETVSGAVYPVLTNAAGIQVGGAHLLGREIACTNGVIHALDTVLQPE